MTEFNELSYDELTEHVVKAVTALRQRAYHEGYEQGKFDARIEGYTPDPPKSPQQIRDEIVAKAKAEVSNLRSGRKWVRLKTGTVCEVEYIVNKEKRTVVVLLKGHRSGDVYKKGIAKADPTDCFNSHIGRAISLRRALGKPVPRVYLDAPAPTEVRVGDVVDLVSSTMRHPYTRTIAKVSAEIVWYTNGHFDSLSHVNKNGKIIDDSRE